MPSILRTRSLRTLSFAAFLLAASTFIPASARAAEEAPEQAERVRVGQPAPAFNLPASDGGSRSLEALHGEKPLVLVFFRGSW